MTELFAVFLILVLKTLLSKMIGDEFGAVTPSVARWLVRKSARWLASDAERYEEEWLADLEDRKTPLRKLLFSLGILWAAATLRREAVRARTPPQTPNEPTDSSEARNAAAGQSAPLGVTSAKVEWHTSTRILRVHLDAVALENLKSQRSDFSVYDKPHPIYVTFQERFEDQPDKPDTPKD